MTSHVLSSLIAAGGLFCANCFLPAHAEEMPSAGSQGRIVFEPQTSFSPAIPAQDSPLPEEDRQFRTRALIAAGVLGVAAYGATQWWQHGVTSNFSTVNEGWFSQSTYAGGADKMGHMYSTYVGTRLLARGFEWSGNSPERSLYMAALTSFGTLAAVEVMDGFSKRFRFSKEDLIMNAVGTGMAVLLERNPELDDVLDFRLMYRPSGDARRLKQVDPIGDHSGQTYLFVAKASGIPALRKLEPLRYFELAAGFGARGYQPNAGGERSRHIYYGISLNVSEILGATLYKDGRGGSARKVTSGLLEVLQIPGTAALADHKL